MIRSTFFWKFYKGQSGPVGCSFDNLNWNFPSRLQEKTRWEPEKNTIQCVSKNTYFFIKIILWTRGKVFLQPCSKGSCVMSKNFSKKTSKSSIKLDFFNFSQKKHVSSTSYFKDTRSCSDNSLEPFRSKSQISLNAMIFAKNMNLFAKIRLEETVFLF